MKENIEELKKEFNNMIRIYKPNWQRIIDVNNISTKIFGSKLRELRRSRDLSGAELGERLSCSKQNISKIENGENKRIPIEKFELIESLFPIPIAYLLGLTDDDDRTIDRTEYYFWENPDSKFNAIKNEVINGGLLIPFETWGFSKERIMEEVIELLQNDYELANAIHTFFIPENGKSRYIREVIINLKNILETGSVLRKM